MHKSVSWIRKLIIGLIGFPIIVVGIILIPLPGPGLLICLLGLIILSFEFEWAKKYADQIKGTLKAILEKAQNRR